MKRLQTLWFDDVERQHQAAGGDVGARSCLRSVKKGKKSRLLGKAEVVRREEHAELEVDSKVEMIRSLVPLGLTHVQELLDDEVKALAEERYARKDELSVVVVTEANRAR